MAKTGRPRKEQGDRGTTQIRVFDEMAGKVSDLLLVLPLTTAQILQRVAGANLDELYETHKEQIGRVKAAQQTAEEEKKKAMLEAARIEEQRQAKSRKPKAGS